MNHKSKLASIAAYGTPSIARAMDEVDTRRFDGVHKAAVNYKPKPFASSFQVLGSQSRRTPEGRAAKVELLRKKIAEGKVAASVVKALKRDYPELRKENGK